MRGPMARAIKLVFDIAFAMGSLIVLAPVLGVIALAIALESRGGVFFRQERLTLGARPFRVFKFRTMVKGAERMGAGLAVEKDDMRVTRVGNFLRATSLDELPQLLNMVKGEMSLIGPRALPVAYLERWDERQRRRLEVRAGLTGWAQIHGRNELPWPERLEMDVWYVENWSLGLDARIFVGTFAYLLSRRGVSDESGSVQEFQAPEQRESRS